MGRLHLHYEEALIIRDYIIQDLINWVDKEIPMPCDSKVAQAIVKKFKENGGIFPLAFVDREIRFLREQVRTLRVLGYTNPDGTIYYPIKKLRKKKDMRFSPKHH